MSLIFLIKHVLLWDMQSLSLVTVTGHCFLTSKALYFAEVYCANNTY